MTKSLQDSQPKRRTPRDIAANQSAWSLAVQSDPLCMGSLPPLRCNSACPLARPAANNKTANPADAPNDRIRIPKGFRPKAQGCEARATLGSRPSNDTNPNRGCAVPGLQRRNKPNIVPAQPAQMLPMTASESQRDSVPKPRVARHELPWGSGHQKIATPTGLRHPHPKEAKPGSYLRKCPHNSHQESRGDFT
jgi:hypothetical protein